MGSIAPARYSALKQLDENLASKLLQQINKQGGIDLMAPKAVVRLCETNLASDLTSAFGDRLRSSKVNRQLMQVFFDAATYSLQTHRLHRCFVVSADENE